MRNLYTNKRKKIFLVLTITIFFCSLLLSLVLFKDYKKSLNKKTLISEQTHQLEKNKFRNIFNEKSSHLWQDTCFELSKPTGKTDFENNLKKKILMDLDLVVKTKTLKFSWCFYYNSFDDKFKEKVTELASIAEKSRITFEDIKVALEKKIKKMENKIESFINYLLSSKNFLKKLNFNKDDYLILRFGEDDKHQLTGGKGFLSYWDKLTKEIEKQNERFGDNFTKELKVRGIKEFLNGEPSESNKLIKSTMSERRDFESVFFSLLNLYSQKKYKSFFLAKDVYDEITFNKEKTNNFFDSDLNKILIGIYGAIFLIGVVYFLKKKVRK